MFYRVVASIHRKEDKYERSVTLPTFYFDGNQLGITSKEVAQRYAFDLLNPFCENVRITWDIVEVDENEIYLRKYPVCDNKLIFGGE